MNASEVQKYESKPRDYKYTKLCEIKEACEGNYKTYCYAYVIDASAPYLSTKTVGKFLCVLKLADDTLSPIAKDPKFKKTIKATFFGNRIEDIPHITSVGSIIRIHRAVAVHYNNNIQLNCDTTNMGAWCIFPHDTQADTTKYKPTRHCKKTYNYKEGVDMEFIDSCRIAFIEFVKDLRIFEFSESLLDAEKKNSKRRDFDILGMLLEKKQKKDKSGYKFKICDYTKVASFELSNDQANPFRFDSGELIRIRGCKYSENSFRKLIVKKHSNILSIPSYSKTGMELLEKIRNSSCKEVSQYFVIYVQNLEERILTVHSHEYENKNPAFLKMLTEKNSKEYLEGKNYLIEVFPFDVFPKKVMNWKSKDSYFN